MKKVIILFDLLSMKMDEGFTTAHFYLNALLMGVNFVYLTNFCAESSGLTTFIWYYTTPNVLLRPELFYRLWRNRQVKKLGFDTLEDYYDQRNKE